MEVLQIPPSQVKVREGLDRYRRDIGKVEDLVKSIQRTRQILPIVINRQYELIDGGRRLAACVMAGINVKAVFEDVIDPYEMRELEVEANLHRKDFSPAEYAIAVRDLHDLKQKRHGIGGSGGKADDSWDISKTAKTIGKSRSSVYSALEIADLVDKFPQLKECKKASDIKKAARAINKLATTVAGMRSNKEAIANGDNLYQPIKGDAIEHMLTLKEGEIDILLTDPLYGIDADNLMQSIGGRPGTAFTTSGYKIEDSTDKAMLFYSILAKESYRFCTAKAHGFIFVGPEFFWTIRNEFQNAGWRAHVKPIIWIKRETGQCNVPRAWPASCYEMLMYIRKDDSNLVQEGKPDWLECKPLNPSEKQHPYQKPIDLLVALLQRVALPGQIVYDPFMGSGSTLLAATQLNLRSVGVEIDPNAYAVTLERLTNVKFIINEEKNKEE